MANILQRGGIALTVALVSAVIWAVADPLVDNTVNVLYPNGGAIATIARLGVWFGQIIMTFVTPGIILLGDKISNLTGGD